MVKDIVAAAILIEFEDGAQIAGATTIGHTIEVLITSIYQTPDRRLTIVTGDAKVMQYAESSAICVQLENCSLAEAAAARRNAHEKAAWCFCEGSSWILAVAGGPGEVPNSSIA